MLRRLNKIPVAKAQWSLEPSTFDTDEGRQVLASAIVGMGHTAGFRVVAEGVEHEAQLVTLRSLGVHAGQGWHLGRPGPLPKEDH